ncbi:MAG: L-threonylcarbamoyladenylate synthase [Phascolarctobacterium sp.]
METKYWKLKGTAADAEAYAEAGELVRAGEVVAFPTETVYGLGANALNPTAVAKIFAAKGRPQDNPLIVHIARKEDINELTTGLNANARKIMEHFMPGPITIIVPKAEIIPDVTSAGLGTVGVRFPINKYAQEFILACGCPIAAPSANISGRPSPTNAQDVLEDMQGKVAGILDGGSCGVGLESTVVDTTSPVPTICRPGGVTYEMLTEVLGAVEIDPALLGDKNFKPIAPGMKYRHYAPKEPVYLLEGEAVELLPELASKAVAAGLKVGVLCNAEMRERLACYTPAGVAEHGDAAVEEAAQAREQRIRLSCWGANREALAADLFYLLRDFDRTKPDVILAQGVSEDGIGLAIMNRLRKAAGYQIITLEKGILTLKGDKQLPAFMIQ